MSANTAGVIAASAPVAPATAPPVAIVVHYRDAASTRRCLASLRAQSLPPQIVVVDNASPDGSGDVLARELRNDSDVEFLHAGRNGGFGAGCNLGIARALARWPALEHVLLLNPDAELEPGGLETLIATRRRHPGAGVVGCRIDDADGRLWFGNGRWRPWTLGPSHAHPPADTLEHRADLITGACMLLAADLLRSGLRFCEDYFLYCEDLDLCRQVTDLGREVWVTQQARARHVGGGSQPGELVLRELTADRLYWLTRSKVILARRQLHWAQRATFLLWAFVARPLGGIAIARSMRFLAPYWRGLRDGLRAPLGARR